MFCGGNDFCWIYVAIFLYFFCLFGPLCIIFVFFHNGMELSNCKAIPQIYNNVFFMNVKFYWEFLRVKISADNSPNSQKSFENIICRQSAKLLSSRRNWASPNPSSRRRVGPPPPVPGGEAHSLAREGGGRVPIQFRRWDIHCGTLFIHICTLKILPRIFDPPPLLDTTGWE